MIQQLLLAASLSFLALAAACSDPSAESHFEAGVELDEEGRFEEAIAEYDESILLDPWDPRT